MLVFWAAAQCGLAVYHRNMQPFYLPEVHLTLPAKGSVSTGILFFGGIILHQAVESG
jgi:hypothetical protein